MDQTPPRSTQDGDAGPHGYDGPHGPHRRHGHSGTRRPRLVREPEDRKIAGVCSGLADHLGIDVTVLRVSAIVLALLTPTALIAYVVASVLMPERQPDQPRRRARRVHLGTVPHPVIVIGAVIAVAAFVDSAWWLEPFPAAIALVGVGVWLIVEGTGNERPTSPSTLPPTYPDDDPAVSSHVPPGWPIDTGGRAVPPADAPVEAPTSGPAEALTDLPTGGSVAVPTNATAGSAEVPAVSPPVEHPMAASPWLVSVSRHSNADSVGDTTLTSTTPGPAPIDTEWSEAAGPSGELPPPASPWWSGNPAASTAPDPATARPSRRRDRRRRSGRVGTIVLALLLVGAGVVWLLDSVDVVDVQGRDALAVALVATGVGLLITSWRGRAPLLIPLTAVLVGILVIDETVEAPIDAGVGDRTEVIDSAAELDTRHELFAGDLTVDLREAPLPLRRPARIEATVGMGELRVIVPPDTEVAVTATSGAGEVVSPGGPDANESGVGLDESFTLDGDGPRLELDLSVGIGSVEVVRD